VNFLSPWAIAIAAGLTIPPLIALYFLKLRRKIQPIPSTLLWKKAIEDLHVNAPFQRLRSSLLLLLQLLILALAALALGKPGLKLEKTHKDTVILMIDQSASMNVGESNRSTRLDIAKAEAKKLVDTLPDGARIMVIAFCDRATVVSSFDTNKSEVKRKIDTIEPTESHTSLSEAVVLAEAYSQNLIIGQSTGKDTPPPVSAAPPASTFIFTDGRIEDSATLRIERLNTQNIQVVNVGKRSDNVGILAMEARRNYDMPEILEVFGSVRNFSREPVTLDAVLQVDGVVPPGGVQTVRLGPTRLQDVAPTTSPSPAEEGGDPPVTAPALPVSADDDSIRPIAWGDIRQEGAAVVEVRLNTDDALTTDNRAWTVVPPPRRVEVLLVTRGNLFLERVLATLPIKLATMTPAEYERVDEKELADGRRSRSDLVVIDGHSTERLYDGNYFFWGGVPKIEGVSVGEPIRNEIVFSWDETHPILRHIPVDTIDAFQWSRLDLPKEAAKLIEGETTTVLAYLARGASLYLICAFSLVLEDEVTGEPMMNSYWVTKANFPVFVYNAVQFLTGAISTRGQSSIRPGEPVTIPAPPRARTITVQRPDNGTDEIATAGANQVHYAKTRQVGVYRARPGLDGDDVFAVNLFDAIESHVAPNPTLVLGGTTLTAGEGVQTVNRQIWSWLLLALLFVLLLEWVVYNKRVFV
jgi:hypothetical protein